MHRALSAENLANIAHNTIEGLRKFLPGREGAEEDLAAMSKSLAEKVARNVKVSLPTIALLLEKFREECLLLKAVDESQPGDKKKRIPDETLRVFFELLNSLHRVHGEALTTAIVENETIQFALEFFDGTGGAGQTLGDGSLRSLAHLCGAAPLILLGSTERIVSFVALEVSADDNYGLAVKTRLMSFLREALKHADLNALISANELKSKFAELNLIETLLSIPKFLQEQAPSATPSSAACAVNAVLLAADLCRSNLPNKRACLRKEFCDGWLVATSYLSHLQTTTTVSSSDGARSCVVSSDGASFVAAELVESVIELATEESFTLQRQCVYSEMNALMRTDNNEAAHQLSAFDGRKWEPLPPTWDTLLASGSAFVWRLASRVSGCVLRDDATKFVIGLLTNLEMSAEYSDVVFRCVAGSLLLLCRSNPFNVEKIIQAGGFELLLAKMTDHDSVLQSTESVDSHLLINHPCWPVCHALVTTLITSRCEPNQLDALMNGCSKLVNALRITPEECEVIESCFQVFGSTVYSSDAMWFDGVSSLVTVPVDRFCGRWYGYSFLTWVNLPCVWSEGCHLFSYSEPTTPSKTVISVVANGKSRCLAVRSTNNKDLTISLLPETTLSEGWNMIVIVHNIAGFTVFVNGKKTSNLSSVPYPKEPAKGQKLTFGFGGADPEIGVPPMIGMVTTTQVLDKDLGDKDIEKIYSLGPGSTMVSVDPASSANEVFRLAGGDSVAMGGSLGKDSAVTIRNVGYHRFPSVASLLDSRDVLSWAKRLITEADNHVDNRASVVVLCVELVASYCRQSKEGITRVDQENFIEFLGSTLKSWDNIPPILPGVLLALVTQKSTGKALRSHPLSAKLLVLFIELVAGSCPAVTRSSILKELSDILSVTSNAKLFREAPALNLASLLRLSRHVEPECVDDLVSTVEKLIKEPSELELAFAFLVGEEESKASTAFKCELARMMYDVAAAAPTLVETMVSCGGTQVMLLLVSGRNHSSEALRIYALRILSLMLHCSKKQRDLFTKMSGFELVGSHIGQHAQPPPKLATFNCLFKFALDSFQPNAASSGTDSKAQATPKQQQQSRYADPRDPSAFNGYLPSMLPQRGAVRRTYSFSSMGSDFSDVEAKLSIDETYQSQSQVRDTIVYPGCICSIVMLLKPLVESRREESDVLVPEASADGIGSDVHETSSSSSKRDDTNQETVIKVLSYLDKLLDMEQNAIAVLPQNWIDVFWSSFGVAITDETYQGHNRSFVRRLEGTLRSIVRKLAVADLARPPKNSVIRRIKDHVDAPYMQRLVIEEVMKHFSTNNRLDVMDANDATNVIKNLDNLLIGLDDCIAPFPTSLGLDVVSAIGTIAGQNNTWVRSKMKTGKFFDTRRQLSLFVLTQIKEFSREEVKSIQEITEANMHEANAVLFLLRSIVENVREKRIEEVEMIQNIVRSLFSMDDDQRRTLHKVVSDQDTLDVLLSQHKVVDNAEVPAEDLISWTVKNEAKWEAFTSKVSKSTKALEAELNSRSEKRERERSSKVRARKTELERRTVALAKAHTEFDKIKVDAETRCMAAFRDKISS